MNKKFVFVVTEDWVFLTHRLPMAKAARDCGFEVHIICNHVEKYETLRQLGFITHHLPFSRGSLSPISVLKESAVLLKFLWSIQPKLIHFVAVRPIVIGAITSFFAPRSAKLYAFTGLGFLFADKNAPSTVKKMVLAALKLGLNRKDAHVLFQNNDDLSEMSEALDLKPNQISLIRGSGVDLNQYHLKEMPKTITTIGFVARMLRSKGVEDLVKASKLIKQPHKILLAGDTDPHNPDSLTDQQMQSFCSENIEWLGRIDNVNEFWGKCHIATLPQRQREGLPKALLEAASAGRAIVTTNVPGCREMVNGENGYLIEPSNPQALATALETLIIDHELCSKMGQKSRELVENELSADVVIAQITRLYESLS